MSRVDHESTRHFFDTNPVDLSPSGSLELTLDGFWSCAGGLADDILVRVVPVLYDSGVGTVALGMQWQYLGILVAVTIVKT